jgi:hypothetical protein
MPGLTEVYWRGNEDEHGTLQSTSNELNGDGVYVTRFGTLIQITKAAADRIKKWFAEYNGDPDRVIDMMERMWPEAMARKRDLVAEKYGSKKRKTKRA